MSTLAGRSAYTTNETKSESIDVFNTFQSNTIYNQELINFVPIKTISSGGFSYLDINFNTGAIEHTLTTGWRFSKVHENSYDTYNRGIITVDDLSTKTPRYIAVPDWGNPDLGALEDKTNIASHNYIIGDDIRFNQQWSALVGVGA